MGSLVEPDVGDSYPQHGHIMSSKDPRVSKSAAGGAFTMLEERGVSMVEGSAFGTFEILHRFVNLSRKTLLFRYR